ncbi:MAG: FprA family A-type flavoprotein [Thermoguttaceae bacterium]
MLRPIRHFHLLCGAVKYRLVHLDSFGQHQHFAHKVYRMTTPLRSNIDWVGYVDWSIRDFHSYDTPRGATYNSYLVRDEKTALIDTVKAPYSDALLSNVASLTPLDRVDYLVCNHAELDHAGSIPAVMRSLPNATLLCNAKCAETLSRYFDFGSIRHQIVTPDSTISLGKRNLAFVNTPMVHWPDSMMTYVPEEKLLFSMDAFGQHLATSVRFDDEWDLPHILMEAKSYYANIVTPYGKQVLATLELAKTLPIEMIAPSHGLIWRKNLGVILQAYQTWASGVQVDKALIIFDSMWDSTTRMAESLLAGARNTSPKWDVQFMPVRKTTLTRIATEMLDASTVAFGSATLNMQMMPQMAAVLTYIRGLKFSPKRAVAFGSSGWAHAGCEQINKWIEETGWTRLAEPVKCHYRPSNEVLAKCQELGGLLVK